MHVFAMIFCAMYVLYCIPSTAGPGMYVLYCIPSTAGPGPQFRESFLLTFPRCLFFHLFNLVMILTTLEIKNTLTLSLLKKA